MTSLQPAPAQSAQSAQSAKSVNPNDLIDKLSLIKGLSVSSLITIAIPAQYCL